MGLLLPLSLCRDKEVRAALLEIPALIDSTTGATMSDKRRTVQARLDKAFGGDLRIADKESLDSFFALMPGAGLFQRLHDSFDYVTETVDNAAGVVKVTGTGHFWWSSYSELMEWYLGLHGSDHRVVAPARCEDSEYGRPARKQAAGHLPSRR